MTLPLAIGLIVAFSAASSLITYAVIAIRLNREEKPTPAEQKASDRAWDYVREEPVRPGRHRAAPPPPAPAPPQAPAWADTAPGTARPHWDAQPPVPEHLYHHGPGGVWWCRRGKAWNIRNGHACCRPGPAPYAFTPGREPPPAEVHDISSVSRETVPVSAVTDVRTVTFVGPAPRLAPGARPRVHQGPPTVEGTVVMPGRSGFPPDVVARLGATSTEDAVEVMLAAIQEGPA